MSRNSFFVLILAVSLLSAMAKTVCADSEKFGVIIGGLGRMPDPSEVLEDLGVRWVRVNNHLDNKDANAARLLEAGFNVIITFNNHDTENMLTDYGNPEQFVHAGFPFASKEIYQRKIREVLAPLTFYLAKGRRIMAQCENEINDASINTKSRYWRGTVAQYLSQLDAFYEAVKTVNSSIPVVLSGFASGVLSGAVKSDLDGSMSGLAAKLLIALLTKGRYDAADLHFYGCTDDITPQARWVKKYLPSGKSWISTENGGPDYRCGSTPIRYEQDPRGYERLQAEQVPQRLSACVDNGAQVCLWFSFFDLKREIGVFSHMGLLEINTPGNGKALKAQKDKLSKEKLMGLLRKKPAYRAFKAFVESRQGEAIKESYRFILIITSFQSFLLQDGA